MTSQVQLQTQLQSNKYTGTVSAVLNINKYGWVGTVYIRTDD